MGTASNSSQHSNAPSMPVRAGVAIVLGVLVNVGIVLGATSLGVAPGFRPLSVPPVAIFSAVGAVGAVVVYQGFRRYVDRADYYFVRVAAVVLVLSFLPDVGLLFGDPAATVPGVVVLMLMHVVVATASVWALVYWTRSE
ncbi:DUF6069 family protein [Halomicroarcula sp. GCM10025324]|uniref:DUF6069 family protein n=1 Tax=Haloarcula TaxID=2237 RepID=UPI0023E7C4C8|nr:DUF6069 family protein [Halomicroarcula sp. ZS-22-S1]